MDEIDDKVKVKQYDVFKDSLLRYLGYANEVGESFRVIVPVSVVRLSYVVASSYVFCDAIHKGHQAHHKESQKKPLDKTSCSKFKNTGIAFMDTLIWQGLASVAIPGFTINRICWLTRLGLKRFTNLPKPLQYWGVVAAGLSCIPVIIKPIDIGVDAVMDKTLRKYYFDKEKR